MGNKKRWLVNFGLFLIVLTSSFQLANAYIPINETIRPFVESRIHILNNDTYFINWSGDEHEYRVIGEEYYGARRILNNSFWLKEIDAHISQRIRIIEVDENNQFVKIGVTIAENPNNPNPTPDLPLRACVNGSTIKRGNRFEQDTDWCNGQKEYYLDRIPFGHEFIIEFDSHPSYEWWLGEGQGGIGNGVPLCEDINAGLINNETSKEIVFTYKARGSAGFQGSTSAGCGVNHIYWEFKNAINQWRTIPTNNNSESLDCKGVSCDRTISNFGGWDKFPRCDVAKNVSTRTRVTGFTPTDSRRTVYSPIRNLECLPPPTTQEEDDDIWFIFLFFAIGAGLGVYTYDGRIKKRNK